MSKKRRSSTPSKKRRLSGYGSSIKTNDDLAAAARRQIRRVTGLTPAMKAVPAQLTDARRRQVEIALEVDSLVVLAVAGGMSWTQLGDYLGTSRQAARTMHARAAERVVGP